MIQRKSRSQSIRRLILLTSECVSGVDLRRLWLLAKLTRKDMAIEEVEFKIYSYQITDLFCIQGQLDDMLWQSNIPLDT